MIVSTSSQFNSTLKTQRLNARQYKEVINKYVEHLDKWFVAHKEKLNTPHARLTKLGIIDVFLKNPKGNLEQDFARTMVYFGRWENGTTFKGQAVAGIELGMLWAIDSLLDLWYKFVRESLNGYDDIVGELFDLRCDLVGLMERYTYIPLSDRRSYTLPVSRRVKPPNIYDINFEDTALEYAGAIFQHIETKNQMEVWSDNDKAKLAEFLAIDLAAQWINPSNPVPWFKSEKDREEKANNLRICRNILNNPEVKSALKDLNERCAKILNRDRTYVQTATGYVIAEDARKQQALYDEMKKRVGELETEWRAMGDKRGNLNELLQAAVEANFAYHEHKQQAVAEVLKEEYETGDGSGAKGKATTYTGDEGKTMYVVTEVAKDSKEGKQIAMEAGGPPNRDLILDSSPALITMNMYQEYALLTANQDMERGNQMMNAVLGLAGEAGEVADLLKKRWYHPWSEFHHTKMSEEKFLEYVVDECGDVQWYLAWIAKLCKKTLGEVAQNNRRKLVKRHNSGNPNANKQKV